MTIVTLALPTKALLGECPRWHAIQRMLYWVDIGQSRLHRFDPATGRDEYRLFPAPVGCFAFMADGRILLGMKNGFAILPHWHAEPEPFGPQLFVDQPHLRMNDGRTDNHGRFWAGSVDMVKAAHDAALYRLTADGLITRIEGGMLTCNGAAFDANNQYFYHTDTPTYALRRYDVDPVSGTLSNATIFHRFPDGRGRPDGGSVDAEGCYWTALFDGWRVVRLSPQGEIITSIHLPVQRPTMIAFGGEDLCTAFVTTARTGLSDQALRDQPLAGSLFSFRVDAPGLPELPFGPLPTEQQE